MPIWATVLLGVLGTDAAVEIIRAISNRLRVKRGKKPQMQQDIEALTSKVDALTDKVDKVEAHTSANYLSILRLTVMDEAMPMSERLIAGDAYISAGGNGDVKHFFCELKKRVDA